MVLFKAKYILTATSKNNKNATTVVASRQEPTDRYAGMAAMAQ